MRQSESVIDCVDLFCGAGGLTKGLTRAGVRVRAGVDLDPSCAYPYESNNKAKFFARDVSKLRADELQEMFASDGGRVRLLAGCAPCQPFSTYSRSARVEREDAKWSLLREFGRLARETRPHLLTMENVPQLLKHRVFKDFLANLAGYSVAFAVLDCVEYGIPQTRKRLVLVASRLGDISLPPAVKRKPRTVRSVVRALPRLSAGESDPRDALHSACGLSALNLARIRASRPGRSWRDWDPALVAECHRKQSGATFPSVYGRMEWDAPSPTITTQCFGFGNGRFGHPDQDRAITLREAAILQTFPKSYRFLPPGETPVFAAIGRLIGNAVPVRLGEVIGNVFVRHVQDAMLSEAANR